MVITEVTGQFWRGRYVENLAESGVIGEIAGASLRTGFRGADSFRSAATALV